MQEESILRCKSDFMTNSSQWQIIAESVRGHSHIRKNLLNQDAIKYSDSDKHIILAVADGHGGKMYFRSDQGSQYAVMAAVNVLSKLLGISPLDTIPKEIVEYWTDLVNYHKSIFNFTDDELAKLDPKDTTLLTDNPKMAYGSTLLAVAVTDKEIIYLQLGDGDILTVSPQGEPRRLIPQNENMLGDETNSLCLPSSWEDFQIFIQPITEKPALIILSTDGYANSFASEKDFLQVGRDYLEFIKESGIEEVRLNIASWLDETGRLGSGDDITVGLIYNLG